MKFYKKYSLIIYLSLIFIILGVFLLSGIYTYKFVEKNTNEKFEIYFENKLSEFSNILKVIDNNSKNKLTVAERISLDFIKTISRFNFSAQDSSVIEAVIEQSGESFKKKIPSLIFGNNIILGNRELVDKITHTSNSFISIWQKTDDGYLRIVSNELSDNSTPNSILFIDNSNPVVQTVEKGEKYFEQKNIKFDSKLSVYSPLYFDGYISAIIQVTVYEGVKASLSKIYSEDIISEGYQLFFINTDGNFVFNTGIDENFKFSEEFRNMKTKNSGYINYETIEQNELSKNTIYFEKVNSLDGYSCLIYSNQTTQNGLIKVKRNLIILFTILFVFFIILMSLVMFSVNNVEKKIAKRLNLLILGNFSPDKEIRLFGFKLNVNKNLNQVYNDKKEIKEILGKISLYNERNFVEFPETQNNLNNYFLKLHKNISNIIEIHKAQSSENELREKLNEGAFEVSAILQHDNNLNSLSMSLLKKIIGFLEIEMGAIFVVNRENTEDIFLQMSANYAFSEEKVKSKTIKANSGLVGRCFMEKQSIFITEIPEDYTKIKSGFGHTDPKSIVIIPLIFNNIVQAVIELASIKIIENFKIEFVERIGENIASTFASIYNRQQTQKLLEQTQHQAKLINTQRTELQEKIDTHRRQNRKLDKSLIEITEIIKSIKMSAFVIEFDLTGKIVDVNEKYTNLLGVEANELIGISHSELIKDKNYSETYKSMWKDLKNGDSEERTEKIYLVEKEQYTFLNIYAPIRNSIGRIYRVLSIGSLLYEEYQK